MSETATQVYKTCPDCGTQRILRVQKNCGCLERAEKREAESGYEQDADRWRLAVMETVRRYEDLPLLLSGGMDSSTLLAALLEMGARPPCYAFRLRDWPLSEDLQTARKMTAAYGLTLTEVEIPSDPESLIRDVTHVIQIARTSRKTAVQCCHVLHYLLSRIARDGHREAITGTGGIAEDNRRAQTLAADYYAPGPPGARARAILEKARKENLLGGDPASATETMKRFGSIYGVRLREPYSEDPLAVTGLSIPWPEMNWPRQKGIALRAFPAFFGPDPSNPRWWRRNSSLQVNGGIRELHDRLLSMPEVNRRKKEKVVAIYNDILKEAEDAQQGLF